MNNITPMPWHYESAESGDRTVGIDPYPPYIYGEQLISPYSSEIIEVAYLNNEPYYQLPREMWSEEELALEKTPEAQFSHFPLGARASGNGEDNARRIVAAINATMEWSTEELEGIRFMVVMHKLYGEIELLKHIISEYEINFKKRGDIWDEGTVES